MNHSNFEDFISNLKKLSLSKNECEEMKRDFLVKTGISIRNQKIQPKFKSVSKSPSIINAEETIEI